MTITRSLNGETQLKVERLIQSLGSQDGHVREQARQSLIQMGRRVAPVLTSVLSHSKRLVRWEAAKALKSLRDPSAAPALVEALTDDSPEVTWIAAEALIALEQASIVPLLRGMEKHFDSLSFRFGAFHVLYALEKERLLTEETLGVLKALRSMESDFAAASAAYAALRSLQNKWN